MYWCAIILLHILPTILPGGVDQPQENKYVAITAVLKQQVIKQGDETAILVTLAPVDGIHITADPPVQIQLARNPSFLPLGSPDLQIEKASGFLATSVPVQQRIRVSPKTRPGEHTIKGTIVYYFCSEDEGWCRKFSQRIALKLNVVQL